MIGWNEKNTAAFQDLQAQIQEEDRLSHRDPDKLLWISRDASDKYWEVAATQCAPFELNKAIDDQYHQPLDFLSGSFYESEEHWSKYEREAFEIFQEYRCLDYLLTCENTTCVLPII